jgi:hypothetical protein
MTRGSELKILEPGRRGTYDCSQRLPSHQLGNLLGQLSPRPCVFMTANEPRLMVKQTGDNILLEHLNVNLARYKAYGCQYG